MPGYEEDGVLLPEPMELLSVMPDDGLRPSVFTSILMDEDVVTVTAEQAFVRVDGVGHRFSIPTAVVAPFIRFSLVGKMAGWRFFFVLPPPLPIGDFVAFLSLGDSADSI